jgi:hypothetical protein
LNRYAEIRKIDGDRPNKHRRRTMQQLSLRLAALATDMYFRAKDERGQATVEYVGLTIVLGTGIGLIVSGLDTLGFATKIGSKLIGGITKALGKVG